MTQDSIITDEMRNLIGIESAPTIFDIEKEPIRRWAEAIGDDNPLYRDEEYARKSRYGGIIAPPGFLGNYAFPVKAGGSPTDVKSPFPKSMGLSGGNEYEFFEPVRVGDVVTATSKIVDLYERQGRPEIGRMLFRVMATTFWNQKGEVVVKFRRTDLFYEGPTE